MAALTEAGLAGDEAFLVAVKRMGSLDALSREFAREHSERLWKQLVMPPDGAGAPAKPRAARCSSSWRSPSPRRLAIKVPALFGFDFDERRSGVLRPQRQPVRAAAAHRLLRLEARARRR